MARFEGVTSRFATATQLPLAAIYDASIKLDGDQRAMRRMILEMSSAELAKLLDRYNVEQRESISGDELAMVLNTEPKAKPKKVKAKPMPVEADEDYEAA